MSRRFSLALMFFILIVCCNKMPDAPNTDNEFKSIRPHYSITVADVNNYIKGKMGGETKSASFSIEPVINKRDTIMFLVNYADGWELLSADSRISRVIAKCDKGNVSLEDLLQNETFSSYFESLSDGIYNIRHLDDISTPDGVKDSWREYMLSNELKRGPKDSMLLRVLLFSDTSSVNLKYKDHLLQTKWGQGFPWNKTTPFKNSYKTSRCYTGCVMVSAAQVLYYLNNTLGYPQYTYGHAFSDSFIPDNEDYIVLNSSQISFSQYGAHWNDMPLNSSDTTGSYRVAALMSWIGYQYGAQYGRTGTGSYTSYAMTFFPSLFDINCQSYNINSSGIGGFVSLVENQIYSHSKPVLMSIRQESSNSGHSVVIDGYRHESRTITNYYAYYIVGPFGRILDGQEPDSYGSQQVESEEQYVAINWGWDGLCDSDIVTGETIWYNIYNDWLTSIGNFNVKNYAVYGFSH